MKFEVWLKGFRSDFLVYLVYYGLSKKELFQGFVAPADPSIQMANIIRETNPQFKGPCIKKWL